MLSRSESGYGAGFGEAVPQRVLPTADHSVVVTHGAVPVDGVVLIIAGIGHHDPGTRSMPRTAATTNGGWIVDVGGGVHNDASEVLRQDATARGQLGHCACRCQIVTKVYDPGIPHRRARCQSAGVLKGSSASKSATVCACGRCSSNRRRYA